MSPDALRTHIFHISSPCFYSDLLLKEFFPFLRNTSSDLVVRGLTDVTAKQGFKKIHFEIVMYAFTI